MGVFRMCNVKSQRLCGIFPCLRSFLPDEFIIDKCAGKLILAKKTETDADLWDDSSSRQA